VRVHRGPAGLLGGVEQAGQVGVVLGLRVERGEGLGGRWDLPEALADEEDAVRVHVPAGLPQRAGEPVEHMRRAHAQHQVVVAVRHVRAGVALVQREPVGEAAVGGGVGGPLQGEGADVDAVGVPVGIVGERLHRPGTRPAAEIEDARGRPPVGAAQEPVDVDPRNGRGDRVVRVRDAAEP
jgi:hypothetical protein